MHAYTVGRPDYLSLFTCEAEDGNYSVVLESTRTHHYSLPRKIRIPSLPIPRSICDVDSQPDNTLPRATRNSVKLGRLSQIYKLGRILNNPVIVLTLGGVQNTKVVSRRRDANSTLAAGHIQGSTRSSVGFSNDAVAAILPVNNDGGHGASYCHQGDEDFVHCE